MSSIGIANLPNQKLRLMAKRGAMLTLMVVGESGLGKTTLINTLFATTLSKPEDTTARHDTPPRKTVEISLRRAELEEKGFLLRLNVIDTPGFGDNINNAAAWQPIVDYIDDQHESYLLQDAQPQRLEKRDMRVHACLYFIRPTGHNLKQLDVDALRALSTRVNVIPVIAKADTLDPEEMNVFKERIRETLAAQNILVYKPLDLSSGRPLADQLPYSVIGAEREVQNAQGELVRGRQYLWGVAEVENDAHCDFRRLRNLIVRTHMLDLIQSTQELHYEAFRSHTMATRQPGEQRSRRRANPQYKEEEQALRKAFTEQVNVEVARFNKWEANLIAERDKLNKDLKETYEFIGQLQQEIEQLSDRQKLPYRS